MTFGKFLQVFLAIFVISLFLTMFFVTPAKLGNLISSEIATSRTVAGIPDTNRVVQAANEWHKKIFGETAIAEASADAHEKEAGVGRASLVLNKSRVSIIERGSYMVYLICFRMQWMIEALVPIAVFIVAAAIDGLAIRRRRAYTFAYTSTVVYNLSSYLVLLGAFVPLIYLIMPFPAPPIMLPFASVGLSAAVWVFFAHLPGSAPILGMQT